MKRALALLEQTKGTMPHLPRPASKEESDSFNQDLQGTFQKKETRMPSANKSKGSGIDKGLLIGNSNNIVTTEISSRKSTAVSTTSRIGSSGNAKQGMRNSGANSFVNTNINLDEQSPIYELSLKNNKKPKPHKLKPLPSAKPQPTSLLDIENAYQKQIMQEIDNDLNDYLDTNQIMSQMNSAFGGTTTTQTSSFTSMSQTLFLYSHQNNKKGKGSLEPIMEESTIGGQVVPYQPNEIIAEQRAKKNEKLKQKVKMLTQGSTQDTTKNSEDSTFMTACRTKEQTQHTQEEEQMLREYDEIMKKEPQLNKKPKKFYKMPEDELLDDLDQHERDMNDMLKYLAEVEDLIKGQDLKSIQQMMDVTKETMNQHFQAYDKFKDQLTEINTEADAAINVLNFYEYEENGGKGIKKKITSSQLAKVYEEDESFEMRQNTKKSSQEENKNEIVNKLLTMNSHMRGFTHDLESRLDKVYKQGASKKYGYDSITNMSQQSSEESKREDRQLARLQTQAQQYLEQNTASALMKGSAKGSKRGSSVGLKALPSSSGSSTTLNSTAAMKRKGSFKKNTKFNEDINNI